MTPKLQPVCNKARSGEGEALGVQVGGEGAGLGAGVGEGDVAVGADEVDGVFDDAGVGEVRPPREDMEGEFALPGEAADVGAGPGAVDVDLPGERRERSEVVGAGTLGIVGELEPGEAVAGVELAGAAL